MEIVKKVIANSIFALQVFIAFLIVVEQSVQLPLWVQSIGRLHPMLLHLPIGFLLVSVLLVYTRKYFDGPNFPLLLSAMLHITALFASLSALMGFFLSFEGGYSEQSMGLHKWLGISLSFVCWVLLYFENEERLLRYAISIAAILLIATGHYGATLTHGEDYILGPVISETTSQRGNSDSVTVFEAGIQPILETKCYSCHNPRKLKGRLNLTSIAGIKQGGKNGAIITPGDTAHSHIVERLNLPMDHKEHMPPKDKSQLSASDLAMISQWIAGGASYTQKLSELNETDTLKRLTKVVSGIYGDRVEVQQQYTFDFVAAEKIQALSIPNRSVFQIAKNEPALQADFYLKTLFERKYISELLSVREQVIQINLSGMPVEDSDLETIAQFPNLEKLILNNTPISGDKFTALTVLKKLESLSLTGTKITFENLNTIGSMSSLKNIYVWNTTITKDQIEKLRQDFRNIKWEDGYVPDSNERMKLTPPVLRNDDKVLKPGELVTLRHNFPGAVIRYSVNGEIDSIASTVYEKPFSIDGYCVVKARAFKDGWNGSDTVEYVLFKKGVKPSRAELHTSPDVKYPGEGAITLINDKKGLPDFFRDPAWIAFRNNPMEVVFTFDESKPIKEITLSYSRNVYAMCMPPASIEVWGGDDLRSLKLLDRAVPVQPVKYVSSRTEGVSLKFPSVAYKYYKLVATPLSKLPPFRKEKKEKGWLMVDEVYFN